MTTRRFTRLERIHPLTGRTTTDPASPSTRNNRTEEIMDTVTCPECGSNNPHLRVRCEHCGEILAPIVEGPSSMPRMTTRPLSRERHLPVPVVPQTLRQSGKSQFGIVGFAGDAQWLHRLQAINSVSSFASCAPGGGTNMGAALDLVEGLICPRILVSDCKANVGQPWDECLRRIEHEHRQGIKWGVIGIREAGCSWNPEAQKAANPRGLYTESGVDSGLTNRLLSMSATVMEIEHRRDLIVLFDVSGSMGEGAKWAAACNALTTLVAELQSKACNPVTSAIQAWTA